MKKHDGCQNQNTCYYREKHRTVLLAAIWIWQPYWIGAIGHEHNSGHIKVLKEDLFHVRVKPTKNQMACTVYGYNPLWPTKYKNVLLAAILNLAAILD